MDLSTTYLGLKLPHPLMPGASPLVDDLDTVRKPRGRGRRRHRDALALRGADRPRAGGDLRPHRVATASRSPRRSPTSPSPESFRLGPDEYLEQLRKVKAGGVGAGDRLAQRHHQRRLARLRQAHRAGRRRRARAERLRRSAPNPTRPAPPIEQRTVADGAGGPQGRAHPGGGQALAVLLLARPLRARARRGRAPTGSCSSTASTSPTSTSRSSRSRRQLHLSSSAELLLRLRWLAILSAEAEGVAGRARGGVHTVARRREGGHGRRARGADGLGPAQARPGVPRRR